MSDMWAENEVYRTRIAELEAEVERLAAMRERSVAEYIKSREYIAELDAHAMADNATLVAQLRARASQLGTAYADERRMLVDAAARIAELEAANAVCRRDIGALMTSCDKLEAERDRLAKLAHDAIDERNRIRFALDVIHAGETSVPAAMAAAGLLSPTTSGE